MVEDTDMIDSSMDGQPYQAARFAATFRRKLYREHLGLMPPQVCQDDEDEVTSFMQCAPNPNKDETELEEEVLVADPLSDDTQRLWNDTARKNREIFTEVFRPVPSNLVRNWPGYDVSAAIQTCPRLCLTRVGRSTYQKSRLDMLYQKFLSVVSKIGYLLSRVPWSNVLWCVLISFYVAMLALMSVIPLGLLD